MSERLRELRDALRARASDDFRELLVSGRADEFLRGILETVEAEIAERESAFERRRAELLERCAQAKQEIRRLQMAIEEEP